MVDLASQALIIIGGILLGGVYALTAIGLTLIFGVSKIMNIAHGDFVMLGALTGSLLVDFIGLDPFVSIAVIFPLFLLLGAIIYRVLVRPVTNRSAEEALIASILVTFGLSMAIEDMSFYLLGTQMGMNFFRITYPLPPIIIFGLGIPTARLVSLVAIVIVVIALWFYISKSLTGKKIRAISQDQEAASLIGVNINRVSMVSFGLGLSLATLAGLFLSMITSLSAYSGMPLTIKALTIIVIGGMGSFPGSLIGGLILGLVESYTAWFLEPRWAPPIAIIVLLIVLLLRPQGLFGEK
jgi:branched-chain amino acid transport system permease protein